MGRKFDIRQWVLLTYDSVTKSPLIYLYSDAYCRFSGLVYDLGPVKKEEEERGRHLTNYTISKKTTGKATDLPNVLLLSEIP